jgi:hypothetical protein
VAGTLVFEHAVFNPAEAPEQRLILYTPASEEETPAKLSRLIARESFRTPLALAR